MTMLKSAYELSSERVIISQYAKQLEREKEKLRKEEKERIDALPDFVVAWEMENSKDDIQDVVIESNPTKRLSPKQIQDSRNGQELNKKGETMEDNSDSVKLVNQEIIHYSDTMPEVHWYGHFSSYSGFSRMNRAMVFGLANRGAKVKVDIQSSAVEINLATQQQLDILSSSEIDPKAPKVFGATLPLNMLHNGKKILYTMMETSETLHKDYVERINLFNEVWVPTYHGAEMFKKNGVTRPIFIMPLGVDTERYTAKAQPYNFGMSFNKFVFISVFKWGYRKGYDILLKAYLDEFSSQDDVSLLLVTRNDTDPNKDRIKDDFEGIRKGIDKQDDDLPHIAVYSKLIPEKDMPRVYRSANAFVLISRGEGFGLPYYEAAACELPVIGSRCSGQSDVLDNDNSFLVDPDSFTKAKINGQLSKLAKHCRFYEDQVFPDFGQNAIEQTRKHMRYVYENYDKALVKSQVLTNLVREEYTWEKAVERVLNRIKELQ